MPRRKRLSEAVRQLERVLARTPDRYRAHRAIRAICDAEIAARFFSGSTLDDLDEWAKNNWPVDAQSAVRRAVNRRGLR